MLEADRGTEPFASGAARKSLEASVLQYAHILRHNTYKTHYGVQANLMVLFVFTAAHRAKRFLQLVADIAPQSATNILVQVEHSEDRTKSTGLSILHRPWRRALSPDLSLST